jgi:crotonobetainyl-CoA:carnitine CoA-transferase CaiB-like acyl-CoA transferase
MTRPLEHVRVLDLTRVLAGPWATQNLADLGAEVLKIERPGSGDETRSWGPPWLRDAEGRETRESAYYLSVNRGKKSVAIDFSKAAGQRLVRALAGESDVLVENFKVGDLARHGLGWEDLHALHPRLVYCSLTGFGQDGPYAHRPGYDFVFQAMGGLMSLTGERDDLPGGGPQKVGIAIADVLGGLYASLAITAALNARERTGEGQRIDLALLDTMVAFTANQALGYWLSGDVPVRHGNAHANIVPYGVFPAADADLVLAVGNDGQFAAFCDVAGRPSLARDARFRTNPDRVRHRAALAPIVADIVRGRKRDAWIESLTPAGVPCGPINDLRQVFDDPQVRHRGLRIDTPHALGVGAPSVASPMRFSATPIAYDVPPPTLGQHTREVLGGFLGMSDAEIDALAAEGVIG